MTKTPDEIKNGIDWGEVDKALQNVRLDNDDNADVQKPKTPEQIKKGLECCSEDECFGERENCPYKGESGLCVGEMCVDALALIQQLQHNNAQLAIDKAKLAAENADQAVRIQQLEKRVIHLEALNQSDLTTITMQERTRARLQVRISQLESERDVMKEALGLMVYQYCVSGTELDHRYMCAGETAFRVLGLEQYGDTRTLESWLFPECKDKEE